jgi:hypothetical protein
MWLTSLLVFASSPARTNRRPRHSPPRRFRPSVRQLEDRTLLSSFNAATVSDLIADINTANAAGGSNTITLTAPTTAPYVLIAADNTTDGPTGLPAISGGRKKADNLTIIGNGDTIERSTASGTPNFRLFDVASGASLTLQTLTLQNGAVLGSGSSAEGGAIFNQGTLVLSGVNVEGNGAVGSMGANGASPGRSPHANGGNGQDAAGGGIWSSGTLTLDGGTTIIKNYAVGGTGGSGALPGQGGMGCGGGVYIAGGTASLTGCIVSGNYAYGGNGGTSPYEAPGPASLGGVGGGVYVGAGVATLSNATVQNNSAFGGFNQGSWSGPGPSYGGGIYIATGAAGTFCNDTVTSNGASYGGGIYIASGATVCLDSFTVANTINNTDVSGTNGSTANIDGPFQPC